MRIASPVFRFLFLCLVGVTTTNIARAAELYIIEHSRCPACIRFHATVGKEYASSPQGAIAPMRRVVLDKGEPPPFLKGTWIRGTPTFLLTEDGRIVGRFDGFRHPNRFWSKLNRLLADLQ